MTVRPILAATDLLPRSDRAIDRALQLGRELQWPVMLVHVAKSDDDLARGRVELTQALRSLLPPRSEGVEILLASGSAPRVICDIATEQDAALVVTGAARFNSITDFVLGTAVDTLIRHSRTPVLVAKHRPSGAYGQVLCAVDFSPASAHALRTVMTLFPAHRVMAIHAYRVGFEGWQKDQYVYDEAHQSAQQELDRFIADLNLREEDLARLEARIEYGDVAQVLEKSIQSQADLLAVGSHGTSGFKQATIGSTASAILEALRADVLVVPPVAGTEEGGQTPT